MDHSKSDRPRLVLEFASREERQEFFDRVVLPGITSQKAAIAVELLGEFEQEAKERQGERTDLKPSGNNAVKSTGGESREKAAQAAGVSPRLVSDAKALNPWRLVESWNLGGQ